jgi:hypothetical protein
MSGPFIFIATNRLKEGEFEHERRRVPGICEFIAANEPRLIASNEFANDERTGGERRPGPSKRRVGRISYGSRGRPGGAHIRRDSPGHNEPQVYGEPSDAVLQMVSRQAGGVPLTVKRYHLGGFIRAEAP